MTMFSGLRSQIHGHFGLSGYWLTFWIMVSCSTAMLLFGYDQGVFGGILTLDIFGEYFGVDSAHKDFYNYDVATRQGLIVGTYDLGCVGGAVAAFVVGGWLGRKKSIWIGTVIMMLGAFLQTFSIDYPMMVSGRVIAGIGNGMNTVTAPVWATECSRPLQRGRNGIILMVVNIVGLAISCWLTYGFSYLSDSAVSWRFPLAFQVFFGIVILNTVPWLPESPRWLMMKHREEEAIDVMVALEGNGVTAQSSIITNEFEDIKQTIALETSKKVINRQLMPKFRIALGIGCQAMQQLTGINVICYYLPVVLNKSVGLSGEMSRLLSGVNATSYLLATFIGLYFIEKWGRRRLMMVGAAGQFLSWMIIAILLGIGQMMTAANTPNVNGGSLMERRLAEASVVFFFIFNIFFGAGWQGVSWLYPTEINTTQKRILGMGLGVGTNWLINFGVVFATPKGIESLGYKFYAIWTVLNLLFVPIIYFFYPETSSRSLEVIDQMFEAYPTMLVYKHKAMTCHEPSAADIESLQSLQSQDGLQPNELTSRPVVEQAVYEQPANEQAVNDPAVNHPAVDGPGIEMEDLTPKSSDGNDPGEESSTGPTPPRNLRGPNRATISSLESTPSALTSAPSIGHVMSIASAF